MYLNEASPFLLSRLRSLVLVNFGYNELSVVMLEV